MVKAGDSIKLLAKPEVIWPKITDIRRWTQWYRIPSKRWGDTFDPVDPMGLGARFALRRDGKVLQVFRVAEWDPPRRFRAELSQWVLSRYIHGGAASASMSVLVTLEPAAGGETLASLETESEFTDPIFGPLLNLCFPLRWLLQRSAFDFFRRFPACLDEPAS